MRLKLLPGKEQKRDVLLISVLPQFYYMNGILEVRVCTKRIYYLYCFTHLIKCGRFLDYGRDYFLLKKDSASCSKQHIICFIKYITPNATL